MTNKKKKVPFDPKVFLATVNGGRSISKYRTDQKVFAQGNSADAVFYIQKGKVKITVVSEQGKEAVVAVLGQDESCGEGCLTGQPLRLATATAMTECEKSAEERDKTQRPIEARRKIVIQSVAKLSRRERQVLALMVTGQVNKRIAHTLGIRVKTIKVHRSRVHQKMGVRSLAELVRTTIGIPLYDTSDIVGPWSNFHPVRMW
jgi:CRP/FNR family cyclic AMP-dependent transcriptional regulator